MSAFGMSSSMAKRTLVAAFAILMLCIAPCTGLEYKIAERLSKLAKAKEATDAPGFELEASKPEAVCSKAGDLYGAPPCATAAGDAVTKEAPVGRDESAEWFATSSAFSLLPMSQTSEPPIATWWTTRSIGALCMNLCTFLLLMHALWQRCSSSRAGADAVGSEVDSLSVATIALSPENPAPHPLLDAVIHGDAKRCSALLSQSSAAHALARECDCWGCSALHMAADRGHSKIVAMLLDSDADIDALDVMLEAPLHLAAQAGDVEVCQMLLERGAISDCVNKNGRTPLLVAGHAGHKEVCDLLLDYGCVVNEQVNPALPLALVEVLASRAAD